MGLRSILADSRRMEVVGEAENAEDALTEFRRHHPDVTLMAAHMPGTNGIEATTMIREEFPGARVIIVSPSDAPEDIHRALQAGAQGYLRKNMSGLELLRAIREVHAGRRHLPKAIAARLAEREPFTEPSPRQLVVLELLVKGLSNREIGRVLKVSENTVKTHVKAIMLKLQVNNRTEASLAAIERGIVHIH